MAGSADSDSRHGLITGINVTPLVDVVLVLLIIFMATAPLIHKRALNVNVPKVAHSERTATETLQIQYTAERQLFVSKEPFTPETLAAELKRRAILEPGLHVSISADAALPYGDVAELLDLVRASGVKKVALEVKPKKA